MTTDTIYSLENLLASLTISGELPDQLEPRHLAMIVDECVRRLNHITMDRPISVPELYSVLGSLSTAVAKLPQLCTQIEGRVDTKVGAGKLLVDPGHGDIVECVEEARPHLHYARRMASKVAHSLGEVQQRFAWISEPSDD